MEADGDDPHLLKRLTAGVGFRLPDLLHHLHSLHHLSENGVLAREVGGVPEVDEELGAVGVGPGVRHGDDALRGGAGGQGLAVLVAHVLVRFFEGERLHILLDLVPSLLEVFLRADAHAVEEGGT